MCNQQQSEPNYTRMRIGNMRLHAAEGISFDWLCELVQQAARDSARTVRRVPAPPGWSGEVIVKPERVRRNHNVIRRLKPSRAAQEGRGYRAFRQRGLPTPGLLAWGESRRFLLFEFGIIVTQYVDAPSVAQAYAQSGDEALLADTARELARIHCAGLAHGDAFVRNFLVTRPRPVALDLASWSRLCRASHLKDLIRFGASILNLTNDPVRVKGMFLHYAHNGPGLPVQVDRLVALVESYRHRPGNDIPGRI